MRVKRIVGLVMIIGSLLTLGFWELWGRENLAYEKVMVLKDSVEKNTIITEEMVEIKKVDNPAKGALRYTDFKKIENMESSQYIPAGTELFMEYFQNPRLSFGGNTGRYVLSIPNQWLMSYPQTLRRGDEVFFYNDGKMITSAYVGYVKDNTSQDVLSLDEQRLQASSEVSLVEVVVDEEQAMKLGRIADDGEKFVLLYR